MAKQKKLYTPTEFAKRNKISRSTVWRWLNYVHMAYMLESYGAKKIVVAGKNFIEQ